MADNIACSTEEIHGTDTLHINWRELGIHAYVKMLIIAVLFCYLFRHEIGAIVQRWVNDPSWSHGFLIPLFSLYFLNQHKKDIIKDSSKAREAITPYIEPFVTTLLDNSINYKCVRSAKLLAQIMGLLEVDKNEININNNKISQVIISKKVQNSEKGMPDDTP